MGSQTVMVLGYGNNISVYCKSICKNTSGDEFEGRAVFESRWYTQRPKITSRDIDSSEKRTLPNNIELLGRRYDEALLLAKTLKRGWIHDGMMMGTGSPSTSPISSILFVFFLLKTPIQIFISHVFFVFKPSSRFIFASPLVVPILPHGRV
jgi:hypothetical protein